MVLQKKKDTITVCKPCPSVCVSHYVVNTITALVLIFQIAFDCNPIFYYSDMRILWMCLHWSNVQTVLLYETLAGLVFSLRGGRIDYKVLKLKSELLHAQLLMLHCSCTPAMELA